MRPGGRIGLAGCERGAAGRGVTSRIYRCATNLHLGYHLGDCPDPLYVHRRVEIENVSRPGISTKRPCTAQVAGSNRETPLSFNWLCSIPISEDLVRPKVSPR